MKPFNLERALAGDPVVTRNGFKIQAIHNFKNELFNILGVIIEGEIYKYSIEGRLINTYEIPTEPFDLFMAPKKRKGWLNILKNSYDLNNMPYIIGYLYRSKEEAKAIAIDSDAIQIEIEWEE